MRSPINKKNWSGWSLPAWWGRWHRDPHPSQEGLTGPQRCIQHRHRWSPVRWDVKTIWIQHSNQLFLDQGWVGGICMQVDKLKLYDTELKLFWSSVPIHLIPTRDGSAGSAYRWPRNFPSQWANGCLARLAMRRDKIRIYDTLLTFEMTTLETC